MAVSSEVWSEARTWLVWLLTGIDVNNVWHQFPATGKTTAEWSEIDQFSIFNNSLNLTYLCDDSD